MKVLSDANFITNNGTEKAENHVYSNFYYQKNSSICKGLMNDEIGALVFFDLIKLNQTNPI